MRKKTTRLVLVLGTVLFLVSCSAPEDRGEAVARVNESVISAEDFREEAAMAARRNPAMEMTPETMDGVLRDMIDRRLMIQAAVEMGISEKEEFIRTIKEYWEQTLIRELIAAKAGEWEEKLFVTDPEVRDYHRKMGYKVSARAAEAGTEEEAEEILEAMLSGELAPGEDLLGPLFVDNILVTDPLSKVFDMEPGQGTVLKGPGGYTAVVVTRKTEVHAPPLEEVEARIRGYLMEQKKQRALKRWLEGLREGSAIEVDRERLERLAHE